MTACLYIYWTYLICFNFSFGIQITEEGKKEEKSKTRKYFVKVEEKNVSCKRKKDVKNEPFISDEHDDHVRAGVLSCVF